MSKTVRRMSTDEVRERQELRRSGASGRHLDTRQRRARTRSAAVRRAVREGS